MTSLTCPAAFLPVPLLTDHLTEYTCTRSHRCINPDTGWLFCAIKYSCSRWHFVNLIGFWWQNFKIVFNYLFISYLVPNVNLNVSCTRDFRWQNANKYSSSSLAIGLALASRRHHIVRIVVFCVNWSWIRWLFAVVVGREVNLNSLNELIILKCDSVVSDRGIPLLFRKLYRPH